MATIKSLTKRLNALDKDRGYIEFHEICWALQRATPIESIDEILRREHPYKTINPALVRFLLNQSSED